MNVGPQDDGSGEPLDDSIPMLTEVVRYDAPAPSGLSGATGEAREALGQRIAAQVVDRLAASPELLGAPMQDALRAAAGRAADTLAASLQATLRIALEPALREAVQDALGPAIRDAVHEALEAELVPQGGDPGRDAAL